MKIDNPFEHLLIENFIPFKMGVINDYRFDFIFTRGRFFLEQRRIDCPREQAVRGSIMIWLYGITAVLALLLLVYLFVALVKPEWF